MSDSDEADDGKALAYEEAALLHAKKPDHPLLKYALNPDPNWEEFIARFGKPGLSREAQRAYPAVAYMFAKYWVALREANQNPDAEIVVSHTPSKLVTSTAVPFAPGGAFTHVDDDLPY